jgi:excisionase family DNA binding protein
MSQGSTGLSRGERRDIPFADRITCTIPEACQVSGLGRTKLYQAMSDGRLEFVKVDNRRLVCIPSLLKLLSAA